MGKLLKPRGLKGVMWLCVFNEVDSSLRSGKKVWVELENGQYALYPNNRMRIYDNSLTPVEPKMPDFKVSTQYYQVENGFERLGMGREDEYFWKTAKETKESDIPK